MQIIIYKNTQKYTKINKNKHIIIYIYIYAQKQAKINKKIQKFTKKICK